MLNISRAPKLKHLIHFIYDNSFQRVQLQFAESKYFANPPGRSYDKLRMLS
ncbi:hypothetical protein D3C77_453410 [compost metagenome]